MRATGPPPPCPGHELLSPSFVFLLLGRRAEGTFLLTPAGSCPGCCLGSWTAASTTALARGRAEQRGKVGGISLTIVDLLKKANLF